MNQERKVASLSVERTAAHNEDEAPHCRRIFPAPATFPVMGWAKYFSWMEAVNCALRTVLMPYSCSVSVRTSEISSLASCRIGPSL